MYYSLKKNMASCLGNLIRILGCFGEPCFCICFWCILKFEITMRLSCVCHAFVMLFNKIYSDIMNKILI